MKGKASTLVCGVGLLALTAGSLVSQAAGPGGKDRSVASAGTAPAGPRVDDADKCNSGHGPDRINGCTRIITSGRLFGKPVSRKNLAIVYNNRGNAFNGMRFHDRAITDYDAAIRLDPGYANAWYNRGVAYGRTGRIDRAIADYDAAIRIDPRFAAAYFSVGNAYDAKREYDRAIDAFTTAIRLDPGYAAAFANRGIVYEKTGDEARAIADFRAALALDASDAVARSNLARLGIAPGDKSAKLAAGDRRTF